MRSHGLNEERCVFSFKGATKKTASLSPVTLAICASKQTDSKLQANNTLAVYY